MTFSYNNNNNILWLLYGLQSLQDNMRDLDIGRQLRILSEDVFVFEKQWYI